MSKASKTPPPPVKPLTKELAAALSITPRRVSQLRQAGMPCDSIAAAEAWRKKKSATGEISADQLRAARYHLIEEQRRRCRLENDTTAKMLVPIGEVKADAIKITSACKMALLGLLGSLPPSLCGLPNEISIFKVLKSAFYDVLTRLSEGEFMEGPEVDAIIESMKPNPKSKL